MKPDRQVTACRIGLDGDRMSRPRRGERQRGRGHTRRSLVAAQRNEHHSSPPMGACTSATRPAATYAVMRSATVIEGAGTRLTLLVPESVAEVTVALGAR